MVKSKVTKKVQQKRYSLAAIGVISIIASYLVFLRAADTGSLQQYAILLVLLFFGLNRLYKAALNK